MKTVAIEIPATVRPGLTGRREAGESDAVRKIEQSINYMLRHLDEPLQVATLAAQANVSPSHFFALFKRQIGCAPIDYFIRLRMRQACRLLDETMMSVKEVAATLGYDDPFYFSRIFKSVNQVAPSEYRLLKNGVKEAVRDCGITMRLLPSRESRPGLECNSACSVPTPGAAQNRLGFHEVTAAGLRNAEPS